MNFNYFPCNSQIFISPTGGYYSDSLAFVSDSCKRCQDGSFVHLSDAPGKSHFDCKACPSGELLDYLWFNLNMPAPDLERELSHLRCTLYAFIPYFSDKTVNK